MATLKMGCWVDSWRGYHMGTHVMQYAMEFGWPGPVVPDTDDGYVDGWGDAEDWLNNNVAPPGYHFGHSVMGDWGMWANEAPEDDDAAV